MAAIQSRRKDGGTRVRVNGGYPSIWIRKFVFFKKREGGSHAFSFAGVVAVLQYPTVLYIPAN